MQPLSEKQAESVWSRVMSAKSVLAEQEEAPSQHPEPTMEDRLLERIREERKDAAVYSCLASRCGGNSAGILKHMSRQECCHAARWETVYYLRTGEKAPKEKAEMNAVTDCCAAFRESYEGELAAYDTYMQLAEAYPEYAELFQMTAQEEKTHAEYLFRILQTRMH